MNVIGQEKTTQTHQVRIDRTTLAAGDSIVRNTDKYGTINSLLLANGGFAVNSIAGINDVRYMAFLVVVGGQLAIVNFPGLNTQMIADGIPTGGTKNLLISVNDAGGLSIYNITLTK